MTIDKIRTSDGAEHAINYEALENLPVIYCKKYSFSTVEVNSAVEPEMDLSSYLPNDGCNYLVTFNCYGIAKSSTAAKFQMIVLQSSYETVYGGFQRNVTANYTPELYESIQIIVGPDRKVKLAKANSGNYEGKVTVSAIRYQKVNAVKVEG